VLQEKIYIPKGELKFDWLVTLCYNQNILANQKCNTKSVTREKCYKGNWVGSNPLEEIFFFFIVEYYRCVRIKSDVTIGDAAAEIWLACYTLLQSKLLAYWKCNKESVTRRKCYKRNWVGSNPLEEIFFFYVDIAAEIWLACYTCYTQNIWEKSKCNNPEKCYKRNWVRSNPLEGYFFCLFVWVLVKSDYKEMLRFDWLVTLCYTQNILTYWKCNKKSVTRRKCYKRNWVGSNPVEEIFLCFVWWYWSKIWW
jgi:hypothetical protein